MNSRYNIYIKRILGTKIVNFISKYVYNAKGLSIIPVNINSSISDLFIWRKDNEWDTFFELLDIQYLVNPIFQYNQTKQVKFIFFNHLGDCIFETTSNYEQNGRNTINISNILPHNINGYGTFACFHLNAKLTETDSYITERGYSGFIRNKNSYKSYLHGNFDAIALDENNNFQMLANYNKRTYIYKLQYEFKKGYNYDIFLTNGTNYKQNIKLFFTKKEYNENIRLNVREVFLKQIFFTQDFIIKMEIESNIYMARPIIFRYHDNSLDVFHG
jgi:hypothetical protein